MSKYSVSLSLAGERYDYLYCPKTKTVCTSDFPDVPVVRVRLGCGHSIDHDTLLKIIEEKQKTLQLLADLF